MWRVTDLQIKKAKNGIIDIYVVQDDRVWLYPGGYEFGTQIKEAAIENLLQLI